MLMRRTRRSPIGQMIQEGKEVRAGQSNIRPSFLSEASVLGSQSKQELCQYLLLQSILISLSLWP